MVSLSVNLPVYLPVSLQSRLPSLEGWLQGLRGRLRGVEAWLQLGFVCLRGGFKESTFPFEVGEDVSFTIEGDRLLIEKG